MHATALLSRVCDGRLLSAEVLRAHEGDQAVRFGAARSRPTASIVRRGLFFRRAAVREPRSPFFGRVSERFGRRPAQRACTFSKILLDNFLTARCRRSGMSATAALRPPQRPAAARIRGR